MHVILTSIGTDGDIFPFIGLGMKLLAMGHTVALAASAEYQPLADANDFPFIHWFPPTKIGNSSIIPISGIR